MALAEGHNGNAIPQKVPDKIFQPFFTTKPNGQGTGLGLSLSYDIVKAHAVEIKAETKDKRRRQPVYYSITNCLNQTNKHSIWNPLL